MIKVSGQGYISELGKRENNEDNCALIKGASYIVCDGVGGAEKGEVASEITVRYFIEAFKENAYSDANQVLKIVEAKLSDYINVHPEAAEMGTTLTFSQVRDDGIYVAWCGDSRIYQFRNGSIIFQTTDHSWVNDALIAGIITPEEAVNHPKSNVITRAVKGSHKPTMADTMLLTDIQSSDLFLHCSDGILETWSDDDLKALFSTENDPGKILEIIKRECLKQSKDNFTAIVYQIDEAVFEHKTAPDTQPIIEAIPVNIKKLNATSKQDKQGSSGINNILRIKLLGIPLVIFLVAILPFIIFLIFTTLKKDPAIKRDKPDQPAKVEIQRPNTVTPAKQESDTLNKNELPDKPANKIKGNS